MINVPLISAEPSHYFSICLNCRFLPVHSILHLLLVSTPKLICFFFFFLFFLVLMCGQQEGTPAAMQMKADVNMSQRTWASQMTKHVMEINKHLQSRLLDLMQCRILWYKEIDPVSTQRRKKRKIETPALQ